MNIEADSIAKPDKSHKIFKNIWMRLDKQLI
jgi:hypothetical protein